jgi:hypothetical protein
MQLERFRDYLLFHPLLHLLSFQIFLTYLTQSLMKKNMAAMRGTRGMMMIQIFRRH